MSRMTGISGVYPIESALFECLQQTVFSLSCVLFSRNDNHHHSTHYTSSSEHTSAFPTTSVPGHFSQRSPHASLLAVHVLRQLSLPPTRPPSLRPFLLLPEAVYFTNPPRSRIPQGGGFLFPQRRRLPTFPPSNRGLPVLCFLFPGPFPPFKS